MCSRNSVKNLTHFTNFPASMFLDGVKKKHLHCTVSRCPWTAFSKALESKCQYIPVNLRQNIFVPETQESFMWWELTKFLKTAHCLDLVKVFFLLLRKFVTSSREEMKMIKTSICKFKGALNAPKTRDVTCSKL